jgi:hypothetical protein
MLGKPESTAIIKGAHYRILAIRDALATYGACFAFPHWLLFGDFDAGKETEEANAADVHSRASRSLRDAPSLRDRLVDQARFDGSSFRPGS